MSRQTVAFATTLWSIHPRLGERFHIGLRFTTALNERAPPLRKKFCHLLVMSGAESLDRSENTLVDVLTFYSNYNGHPPEHLSQILNLPSINTPLIFLAGDSTLDNKYWLPPCDKVHPNRHYQQILSNGPISRDIAYWLAELYPVESFTPINCAVEASTLRQRLKSGLLPQDVLIREHIGSNDILVVSVGGNDIALSPTIMTVFAVLANVYGGGSWGMPTLSSIFHDGIKQYIEMLVSKQKPRLVVICMLYFPDETVSDSWASLTLRALRYNSQPHMLQSSIVRVFENAIKNITIDGCPIVFAPLFDALDGKRTEDYVERVEPSERGGNAVASLLKKVIDDALVDEE